MCIERELFVADIEDDILLGIDILQRGEGGPADILLGNGIMILNNVKIPLHQIPIPKTRRAVVCNDTEIPGMSEAIIKVSMDMCSTLQCPTDVVIEGSPHLVEKHSLILAPTLARVDKCNAVHVRVLNPFQSAKQIKEGTCLGYAEILQSDVEVVLENEDALQNENHAPKIALTQLKGPAGFQRSI